MRTTILLSPALSALLLMGAGCSSSPAPAKSDATPVKASVITVAVPTGQRMLELAGTVEPRQSATLSSQIVAPVRSVRKKDGDRIRKGEVLIELAGAQWEAGAARARSTSSAAQQQAGAEQADFVAAEATWKRYQNLFEKKSVSPHEMDLATARYESAKARRDAALDEQEAAVAGEHEAGAMLGYTSIRAPFDGVVSRRLVDPGAMAAPGAPMMQVQDDGALELHLNVTAADLAHFHAGMSVDAYTDADTGKKFAATVTEISPSADPASHTFLVKLKFDSAAKVHAGTIGHVLVAAGGDPVVELPRSAVLRRGQLTYVLVRSAQEVAEVRYVTLGTERGDKVEVLTGLRAGEALLREPKEEFIGRRIEAQP